MFSRLHCWSQSTPSKWICERWRNRVSAAPAVEPSSSVCDGAAPKQKQQQLHAETLVAVNAKRALLDQKGPRAPGKLRLRRTRDSHVIHGARNGGSSRLLPLYKYYGYSIHMCRPIQGKDRRKQNVRLGEWAMIVKRVGRDFSGLDRPPNECHPPPLHSNRILLFYFALADSGTRDRRNLPSTHTQTIHCNATTHALECSSPQKAPYSS